MRYLRRHAQKISSEHNLHAQFSILLQNARLWKMYSSRLPGILNSTILLYCCSVGFVFTFMFHVFYFVILIVLVPGHVISPLVYVSCSYWLIQTCVHQFYFLIGSLSCHMFMSSGCSLGVIVISLFPLSMYLSSHVCHVILSCTRP